MAIEHVEKREPHELISDAWVHEAQAQVVEDKLAWLIDTATPEEPPKQPEETSKSGPTQSVIESDRLLSKVESDVLWNESGTKYFHSRGIGDLLKWMVLPGLIALLALFIAVLAFAMIRREGQVAAPAAPAQPAAAEGRLWYFTNTQGLGLYTIALKGDGTSGAIDVIEDATDQGTYTWVGDKLTIDFTRKLTMADGYVITEPWSFVCTGTTASTEMSCDVTRQKWAYSGRDGFQVVGENSWPAVAVPR